MNSKPPPVSPKKRSSIRPETQSILFGGVMGVIFGSLVQMSGIQLDENSIIATFVLACGVTGLSVILGLRSKQAISIEAPTTETEEVRETEEEVSKV